MLTLIKDGLRGRLSTVFLLTHSSGLNGILALVIPTRGDWWRLVPINFTNQTNFSSLLCYKVT